MEWLCELCTKREKLCALKNSPQPAPFSYPDSWRFLVAKLIRNKLLTSFSTFPHSLLLLLGSFIVLQLNSLKNNQEHLYDSHNLRLLNFYWHKESEKSPPAAQKIKQISVETCTWFSPAPSESDKVAVFSTHRVFLRIDTAFHSRPQPGLCYKCK
jgi:hypothetical protein